MQDWLNDRGLDRKALQALAINAAAVEDYEAQASRDVQECMQGLLALVSQPASLMVAPYSSLETFHGFSTMHA